MKMTRREMLVASAATLAVGGVRGVFAAEGRKLVYRPGVYGGYDVWIRWDERGGAEDARIEIAHAGGVTGYAFDQANSSGWHFAGSYFLRLDSEIVATNRSAFNQPNLPPPRGFDEVRLVPTARRTVELAAHGTASVCELNVGDTCRFTLANGQVRTIELKGASWKVLERRGDDVRRYSFTMDLEIGGRLHPLTCTVPSVDFLNAKPFEIDGMHLWPDAVSDIFRDGGGYMLEKDFRHVAGTCRPMRRARLVLQDATGRIVPEKTVWWWPAPSWPLDPNGCYNGRDCWMGPWYEHVGTARGGETHCGIDVNMPKATPLQTPFAVDEQHYFHSVKKGNNNNRWRAIRHWSADEWWWIQSHHIDTPYLVPEGGPLARGTRYALSGGMWAGEFTHTHFNLRIFTRRKGADGVDEIESFWVNPALIFRQMQLDNPLPASGKLQFAE